MLKGKQGRKIKGYTDNTGVGRTEYDM